MGLTRVEIDADGNVLAEDWRDFVYADALGEDTLAVRGLRKAGGRRGNENLIFDGSIVNVLDGQCMLIMDRSMVVDLCAEPGAYVYDASTEPSLLFGNLGENLLSTFDTAGVLYEKKRSPSKEQRVYYFNIHEMPGSAFETERPVLFREVDASIGLDADISIRCYGEYTYRIADPMLFCLSAPEGIQEPLTRDMLEEQLDTEFLEALGHAFAMISGMGIRYGAIPGRAMELADALNDVLYTTWRGHRGIEIVSLTIGGLKASGEDEAMIRELRQNAVLRVPGMLSTRMDGEGNARQKRGRWHPPSSVPRVWSCACGAAGNTGPFCVDCGKPMPPETGGWTCVCGEMNKTRYCAACGRPRPMNHPKFRCDRCGWEPDDAANPPKLCPECGDVFDERDLA